MLDVARLHKTFQADLAEIFEGKIKLLAAVEAVWSLPSPSGGLCEPAILFQIIIIIVIIV